jgi:acyl-coenzyme A thioesterase PaaI-like protein
MAYFERLGAHAFRATEHTGGAWDRQTQHIAPALGLLAHAVEHDRDVRRSDGLVLTRLSYDILGTVPIAEVDIAVEVLRTGRTIELVEAVLAHAGRPAVRLRAWLMEQRDTSAIAGTGHTGLPSPDEVEPWDPTTVWRGGFIATAEVRRRQLEPGRALIWVRTDQPLLDGENVSRGAAVAGLLDIANGMTVRAAPEEVAFPNVDLTAHLVRPPADGWLGLDTTVTFGADGIGLTASVVHDERGPIGTSSQCLTVRPSNDHQRSAS